MAEDVLTVTLDPFERAYAAQVGVARHQECVARGYADRHAAAESGGVGLHYAGALGECALAKWLGVYWRGKGDLAAADVGPYDCRTTAFERGHLILHKEDDPDRAYYLMVGSEGAYRVAGWLYGREGQVPEHWREAGGQVRSACYWIPQSALRSALVSP